MLLRKGNKKDILELLNGVVCIYKPPDVTVNYLKKAFTNKLCTELNNAHVQHPTNYLEISADGSDILQLRHSYEDNVLAAGPRYTDEDICTAFSPIGRRSSGVCITAINEGIEFLCKLKNRNPLKILQVKATLGQVTQNFYKNERVVAKACYKRVNRNCVDKIVSSIQAAHQRKIFHELGLDLQSQEAYELAVQGMVRPKKGDYPCIYSIKCIDFVPPNFTLEMACINENEEYLLQFIHDLGLQLRTYAHCTGLRYIRYGPFTVENALINKQWTLRNLVQNIKLSKMLIKKSKVPNYSAHLQKMSKNQESNEYLPRLEKDKLCVI